MNLIKLLAIFAIAGTISACGDDFEWFPSDNDKTAPVISATVAGQPLFNNQTTHVSSLASATVAFQSNEVALIYYTTNGTDPTTTSAVVDITAPATNFTGPSITATDTILKFFGIDKSINKNPSAIITSIIKSP